MYQRHVDLRNNLPMKMTHPSYERLVRGLQNAKAISEKDWRPSDVRSALNVSAQTANNWVERGVSQDGAIEAQKRYGINLCWILDGVGNPSIARASDDLVSWPFKRIPKDFFGSLNDWERLYVEDVVFRLIGKLRHTLEQIESEALDESWHLRKSSNGK